MQILDIIPGGFTPLPNTEDVQVSAEKREEDVERLSYDERYNNANNEALRLAYMSSVPDVDMDVEGRYDLFDPDALRETVLAAKYSQLLRRQVFTYKDALDLAYETMMAWHRQDNGMKSDFELDMKMYQEELTEMEAERELRRVAWRVAVATRKEALVGLDEEVRRTHQAYNEIRHDLKRKAKEGRELRRQRKLGPEL